MDLFIGICMFAKGEEAKSWTKNSSFEWQQGCKRGKVMTISAGSADIENFGRCTKAFNLLIDCTSLYIANEGGYVASGKIDLWWNKGNYFVLIAISWLRYIGNRWQMYWKVKFIAMSCVFSFRIMKFNDFKYLFIIILWELECCFISNTFRSLKQC